MTMRRVDQDTLVDGLVIYKFVEASSEEPCCDLCALDNGSDACLMQAACIPVRRTDRGNGYYVIEANQPISWPDLINLLTEAADELESQAVAIEGEMGGGRTFEQLVAISDPDTVTPLKLRAAIKKLEHLK